MSHTERFKAAQQKLLSARTHFTLDAPPSIGWWKAKLDRNLPAIVFIHHYQSVMGRRTSERDGLGWNVELTAVWQAASAVTPKQWEGLKSEVGVAGADLLAFRIHNMWGDRATWVRPRTKILEVFGIDLSVYDDVTKLDIRITKWRGSRKKVGLDPVQSISEQEWDALRKWAAVGGLPRLRNAEELTSLLSADTATDLTAARQTASQNDVACTPKPHIDGLQ